MNNSLRFKAIAITLVSLLIITTVAYAILNQFFMERLLEQERAAVEDKVFETKEILNQNMDALGRAVMDWGPWDETYSFSRDLNEEYIAGNLNPETLANLQVHVVVFLDEQQKINFAIRNSERGTIEELPESFLQFFEQNSSLMCSYIDYYWPITGIIKGPGGPMFFASAPIIDSNYQGEQRGTLVFSRYIDEGMFSTIEKMTKTQVEIYDYQSPSNLPFLSPVNSEIKKLIESGDIYVEAAGADFVDAYSVLTGLDRQPLFLLKVSTPRTIFNIGRESMLFLDYFRYVIAVAVLAVVLVVIQNFVIKPIFHLREEIKELDLDNLSSRRLTLKGKGEISDLAGEINKMLSRIEEGNKSIREGKEQLQQVMEGAKVGFWDFEVPARVIHLSRTVGEWMGFAPFATKVSVDQYRRQVYPEDLEQFLNVFEAGLNGDHQVIVHEFRVRKNNEEYKWVGIRGNVVERDQDGNPLRVSGIVMDIDDRKKVEEELKHLTHFDRLTGLYHRGYFEYLMEKMIAQGEFPFALVTGDINGLKSINDNFGHSAGDKIIVGVAEVLKKVCGDSSIICRWGGDEFAVILPGAGISLAEEACLKISCCCFDMETRKTPLNISLGYSVATEKNNDLQVIIKQAEERMFRNKLFDDSSARSGVVLSLHKALKEKSYETEEHMERIGENCLKLGRKLGLKTAQIDELLLLALMHDIGKIAIPDYILEKEGPLNEMEWETMKTHAEIGYRIASATPELSHIADEILAHHEHFDGSGYPNGLEGDSIPLLSRILSIVDAYDVMSHDRTYKKAMTRQEAVQELKRCSGTQFDPQLVDMFISILEE